MTTIVKYIIQIGSRAIWISGPQGECLGRFGVYGIDIHRRLSGQHLGECLDCTHGRVNYSDWVRFVRGMSKHHDVDLSSLMTPGFVSNEKTGIGRSSR